MKSKPSPATSKQPRLRVGLKDGSREEFAAAVNERLGKQRASIMIHEIKTSTVGRMSRTSGVIRRK